MYTEVSAYEEERENADKDHDALGFSKNDFDDLANQIASYKTNIEALTNELQRKT